MPIIDFLIPTFAGGLIDGLANDTASIQGLRVCDNADFGQAPIGGITVRPPTTIKSGVSLNDNVSELDDTYIDLHPRWLLRFRDYDNDDFPYWLVGRTGLLPINRDLTEFGVKVDKGEDGVAINSRNISFSENKA